MLRPWTLDDVPAIVSACNEGEIARWIHQIPSPYGDRDAREYVLSTQAAWTNGAGAFFAFEERTSGEVAGSIAVHVLDRELANLEVGYWTGAPSRGRGLTTRLGLGTSRCRAAAAARRRAQPAISARGREGWIRAGRDASCQRFQRSREPTRRLCRLLAPSGGGRLEASAARARIALGGRASRTIPGEPRAVRLDATRLRSRRAPVQLLA